MNKKLEIVQLANRELPQLRAVLGLSRPADADTETLALQEIEYLHAQALTKPEIYDCNPLTVVTALRMVLKQNLSLDPYAGLVYVKTRSVEGASGWEKILEITPSANGLISIARQCGRILDVDRPEITKDATGKVVSVKFRYLKPSFDERGNPCARWQETEFDESDFYRWRRASHVENGRRKQDANRETMNYANAHYTNWKGGPDPEFIRAKAIRHGLKKLGVNPNESRITTFTAQRPVVDIKSDSEATGDDTGGYTSYEEMPPATVSANPVTEVEEELPVL